MGKETSDRPGSIHYELLLMFLLRVLEQFRVARVEKRGDE